MLKMKTKSISGYPEKPTKKPLGPGKSMATKWKIKLKSHHMQFESQRSDLYQSCTYLYQEHITPEPLSVLSNNNSVVTSLAIFRIILPRKDFYVRPRTIVIIHSNDIPLF